MLRISDIDECELNIDNCEGNCTDTEGNFTCSCNEGYRLQSDGFSCGGM